MKQSVFMQSANSLGSTVELRIVTDNQLEADDWFVRLWDSIQEFQNRYSRFLPDSEVTYLNQNAGNKLTIDDEFKKLLQRTKHFSRITDGLFNPFVLPMIQKAGYVTSLDNPHLPELNYSDRNVVDVSKLELGKSWVYIPENTAIDLGGIGKGYLADELGQMLNGEIENYCLSIGGDIFARGSAAGEPWDIKVQSINESILGSTIVKMASDTFAVATSGTTRSNQQHIIDPRTLKIAKTDFDLCTIVADDTTTADVLASCILIGGKKLASGLMQQNLIKGVLLQKLGGIKVILGNCFGKFDSEPRSANQTLKGLTYA